MCYPNLFITIGFQLACIFHSEIASTIKGRHRFGRIFTQLPDEPRIWHFVGNEDKYVDKLPRCKNEYYPAQKLPDLGWNGFEGGYKTFHHICKMVIAKVGK
jgi:hypothetical protein